MQSCVIQHVRLIGLLGLAVVSSIAPCFAEDPARVKVRETSQGKTVTGAQGELLRGSAVAVYKFRRDQLGTEFGPAVDYATDPAYWDRMKAAGVNAVRLVFFDPWQRSHGDPDLDPNRPFPFMPLTVEDVFLQGLADPGDTAKAQQILRQERFALFRDFDAILDLAADRDMYVMINYHDVFGYKDPDFAAGIPDGASQFTYKASRRYLRTFWFMMSARYKDRTHVFFELMNEPVGFHPNDTSPSDVRVMSILYHEVRARAPDTHLVLGSFVTPAHFGSRSMVTIAQELEELGVDFSNASIGYHGYNISDALPHEPSYVTSLSSEYPVINTEQNFPASVDDGVDDPDAPGYFDDLLGHESLERLNISWFAWNTLGPEEFGGNFEGILKPDAEIKGYFWDLELDFADLLRQWESYDSPTIQVLVGMIRDIFLRWTDI